MELSVVTSQNFSDKYILKIYVLTSRNDNPGKNMVFERWAISLAPRNLN